VQEDIFLESEADAWFQRNKSFLTPDKEHLKWLLNELQPFGDSINDIAEIGCASGINLNFLCSNLKARGVGVDPSKLAIENARQIYADKQLDFFVGTADNLYLKKDSCDLVYVGFCLYLVSEEKISLAIEEMLRIVKPGGFLVITDFDYGKSISVPYSHDKRVTTFKRDYSKLIFAKTEAAYLVSKTSFSHLENTFNPIRNERISTSLFYKEI
jgi:ubiquinone/menaquinone biosynthesis C-methylase UbiE